MISLNPAKLNRCDWYIAAWGLYYLQGIVYNEASTLSYALLGVNLLISAICAIKILPWSDNPIFFNGLNILMIMFTVYGVLYILANPYTVTYVISGKSMSSYNYIKNIYLSLLPIYAFYYFSRTGYLTKERLQRWGFVFLVLTTLFYFRIQQEMMQRILENGGIYDESTNNVGYMFLSCIPLLVLYRRELLQYVCLSVIMIFIIMSMKRGAIVIGVFTGAYIMYQTIKYSKSRKMIITLVAIVFLVAMLNFFEYRMNLSDYMIQRVQATIEGNSSGRDDLYSFFWTHFIERTDALHYLFGRGANGTLELYYNYAHNDWLEIAVNQGLLGIIIYAIYWVCFYKTWKYASNSEAKQILFIIMLIFFAKTMFSMSYGDMTYVVTSVQGYALATTKQSNT